MSPPPLRILGIEISNMLNLKAVSYRFDPEKKVLVVSGKNGHGKTSFLNCIQLPLTGKAGFIDEKGEKITEPVKHGAKEGRIFLDIGHLTTALTIEATWEAETGKYKLTVRDAAGDIKKSPQALLDTLYSALAFDPGAFDRMKAAEQVETLSKLVGVDLTPLTAKRQSLYNERELKGRELRTAQAKLQGSPFFDGMPAEPLKADALLEKLSAIQTVNASRQQKLNGIAAKHTRFEQLKGEWTRLDGDVRALQKQIEAKVISMSTLMAEIETLSKQMASEADAVKTTPVLDESPIKQEIQNITLTNQQIAANLSHHSIESEVTAHKTAYDKLSFEIDTIDQEKRDKLEWAEFPIPGLSLSDTHVTFEGIPLNQVNTAMRSRIGVTIAAAMNPRLATILIRHGNDYDDDSMAAICDEAQKRNLQIIIEKVKTDDPAAVVIENGELK